MSRKKKTLKSPVVAISFGESSHWKNKGALPGGRLLPLGTSIRPISRKMIEAVSAGTVPCCLSEAEWIGVTLGDRMGGTSGRTAFHLAFLLVHRSVDIRNKNIAEALWRAFDDGVTFKNSVTLNELKVARREADIALGEEA